MRHRNRDCVVYRVDGRWYFSSSNYGCDDFFQIWHPRARNDALFKWLDEKKCFLKDLPCDQPNPLVTHPEWTISKSWPFIAEIPHTVYELDLDEMVLYVDREPMFRFDDLPPQNSFTGYMTLDHYGLCAAAPRIPWCSNAGRYLTSSPPLLSGTAMSSFLRLKDRSQSIPIHDLISRYQDMPFRESVCANMLALFAGSLIRSHVYRTTLRDLHFVTKNTAFTQRARWLMYLFIRLATCPIFYHQAAWQKQNGVAPWEHYFQTDGPLFWWPRRHICVRLSTYLHDERNCQLAIAELVSEITKKDGDSVVYGVAFSLIQCVFIRVDRERGGSFQYTDPMEFLPSRFAESAVTPGMAALVRVGHLPGSDDLLFYRRAITRALWRVSSRPPSSKIASDSYTLDVTTSTNLPVLPIDVLTRVAHYIESADTLNAFACSCKSAMVASVPWLKYPQVQAVWQSDRDPGPTSWASVLVHGCVPASMDTSGHTHLWRGEYQIMINGRELEPHSTGYFFYHGADAVSATFSLVFRK